VMIRLPTPSTLSDLVQSSLVTEYYNVQIPQQFQMTHVSVHVGPNFDEFVN